MSASLSARRLSEPLKEVDRRLWAWADWAREFGDNVGWPGTSVAWRLARIHETGQSFASHGTSADAPAPIIEVESAVLRLPYELRKVVYIQYFSYDPVEAKARKARTNVGVFSQALNNARWSVKTVLGI